MDGREEVPDRHVAGLVDVVVAELRLQDVGLDLVEESPRCFHGPAVDFDRDLAGRPRAP
ncbi:MAG: hypothetical protein OXH09_00885 [Gammaproteobacteria bacterium]|nr:hypothetical protein [Gammaproteobacteria bacterium]